jgi:hypothetical protein
MGNKTFALILAIATSSMLGCVSADTEGTTGTEDEARQEPGLTHSGEAGGDGDGDGDGDADSEALKSSESEIASAASPTGADLAGSKSDVGQPSNQPTHSLLSSCPATSRSWWQSQAAWNGNTRTAGTYICTGNLPMANHGNTVAATLASMGRVGSAQYTCNNGTWLPITGASCDGKVISTTTMTCSSADPVKSKWVGWYLTDLKRCADTAGLEWWVNNYNNNAACFPTDNYNGYGSKDACWRAYFRSAGDANGEYSEAQLTGHIAAVAESNTCNGLAYPWTSVSAFGTSCKPLP